MNRDRTALTAWLIIALIALTACSGDDAPPVTTTAPPANPALVANAGPDQSAFVGTFIKLNGIKSFSTENPVLSYRWSLRKPAGSTASLSDSNIPNPTLTVDIAGTYEAILTVNDGKLTSSPDTVLIVVGATNVPPAAAIAPYPHALFKTPLTLDGSQSNDANQDFLIFKWKIVEAPTGSTFLSNPTAFSYGDTAAPIFTPDFLGLYKVQLIVNDGTVDSAPAEITISAENKPGPIANAGGKQTKPAVPNVPTTFQLQGSGTAYILNSDGTTTLTSAGLVYKWDIIPLGNSPTPIATTGLDTATASFTVAANLSGAYTARLTVTEPNHPDPTRQTALDQAYIAISPEAIALPDGQIVTPGSSLLFTGDTSIGPKGTGLTSGLTYSWTVVHTPASGSSQVTFPSPYSTRANPPPISTSTTTAGTYSATLTVTDPSTTPPGTDSDSATFVVSSGPIINSISLSAFSSPFSASQTATPLTLPGSNGWAFPADRFMKPGSPGATTFTASLSGIVGTPTCTWSATNNSNPSIITINNVVPCTPTSATATIQASQAGTYNITLQVSDTSGQPPSSRLFSIRVATPPSITLSTPNSSPGVCTQATVDASTALGSNPLAAINPYSWSITPPTPPARSRSSFPSVGYSSVVGPSNSLIPVQVYNGSSQGSSSTGQNPAVFTVNSANTSAVFRPDVPGTFTVRLGVTDSAGIITQESLPLISPSQVLSDSSTHATLLSARNSNGSCGSCHNLGMWNYSSGSTSYPEHSAKGLQLFLKFNADGSTIGTHDGGALPSNLLPREALCALYQDLP